MPLTIKMGLERQAHLMTLSMDQLTHLFYLFNPLKWVE
jgi:hypothetical protein